MGSRWQRIMRSAADAFAHGDLAAGRDACARLLSTDGLPPAIDARARQLLIAHAPVLHDLVPDLMRRQIRVPVERGWSCFNPSIAANPGNDGFTLVVRSSNYRVDARLRYETVDGDPFVRTENLLLALDADLSVRSSERIDDREFRASPPQFIVTGFEDARLVAHHGTWWLSATTRDRNPEGICQITLLRLCGARVAEMRLVTTGQGPHEKNWMPAAESADGRLRFIYAVSPTIVVVLDDASGRVEPEIALPGPPIARGFRGGSQAIPLDGGHLCLVHERADLDDGRRLYAHRWVWFDHEWRVARISPPFALHERGIEFVAGLARRDDRLIVSYGAGDRAAWLATLPVAAALRLLSPVPEPEEVAAALGDGAPPVARKRQRASRKAGSDEQTAAREDDSPASVHPGEAPSIVSVTLSGNSRKLIGGALRSVVDWVDACLVIDTGITDDTLEVARGIAGEKLLVRGFPWCDDFAAARNFALAAAAETGATWAVMLDTDERLLLEADPRPALAASPAAVLHVTHVAGTYAKERIFRLPAAGAYVGPTHEGFVQSHGSHATLDGLRFDELGKSPAAYRRKAERDIAILTSYIAEHPREPRWHYYLGDSYAGLGRHEEAVAAFRACSALNGWDEEGAWAMYRAAESLLRLGRPAEAVEACAAGMARHAGMAELPWLAAYASWQAGRPEQAVHWARLAAAQGHFLGSGGQVRRGHFRHPPALWEGPFDVLRFALRAIGDDAGAEAAERLYRQAKARRKPERAP